MMVVIVEFELRAGAEPEFETALKHNQEQVKQYDGFLGETPCPPPGRSSLPRCVDATFRFVLSL